MIPPPLRNDRFPHHPFVAIAKQSARPWRAKRVVGFTIGRDAAEEVVG